MIFRFKQFAVSHGSSSMRVGTDAVVLGAWAEIKNSENILDIGTGSGLIALMMAQRNEKAKITAIDIHPGSVSEAGINFMKSPWKDRLLVELISLQEFTAEFPILFDHIISNPPYFSGSTPAPERARHLARHTDSLSHRDFFIRCKTLLIETGKISMIFPFMDSTLWIKTAREYELHPSRITHLFSYPGKPIERMLIEFTRKDQPVTPNEFYIRTGKGKGFSEEYVILTGDFYL